MAFLDVFRRKDKSGDSGDDARMEYGSRGEEIAYRRGEKMIIVDQERMGGNARSTV